MVNTSMENIQIPKIVKSTKQSQTINYFQAKDKNIKITKKKKVKKKYTLINSHFLLPTTGHPKDSSFFFHFGLP